MNSKLDIIIGCMFSGKSTELIKRIRTARVIFKEKIMIVNHEIDNRYNNKCYICSHDMKSLNAISTSYLLPLLSTVDFADVNAIFIDESQFFDDLYEFVKCALKLNKWVVVCGLDGDFEQKPFGQILDLIPLSDSICKLSALCKQCNDGTPAIFSKRTTYTSELVEVGSENCYEPVCRRHFNTE